MIYRRIKYSIKEYLDKKILRYPVTLNFMANDICNSKCKMCNIWKRKKDKELTPEELENILNDDLFKNLSNVGISGGEPTLRDDLPDIVQVFAKKEGTESIGIITNAIQTQKVIKQIDDCEAVCAKENVNFNVMVSLDGVGHVHDEVRSREGNFESALQVINHVKNNANIPLSIGCTIVKENVWYVDDVLDFCIQNDIYAKFRVAEFIDRLYNEDLNASIKNFDDDEKYNIALFFFKLEHTYEKDISVKETYSNIRKMIFEGKKRQSGCPYQINAVVLDCRGDLIYCSPKSPVIGSCSENSALDLYKSNIDIRNNIIKDNCDSCVHDYHAFPKLSSLVQVKQKNSYINKFNIDVLMPKSIACVSAIPCAIDWLDIKRVLIVGWYGTETVGDKAILAEIIRNIKNHNNKIIISIASLYPFVTKKTLQELGCVNEVIIDTYSEEYSKACVDADVIMMGGGPLMHIETLGVIMQAFILGQKSGSITVLEGCGIGPLIGSRYSDAVKEIVRLASVVRVRDAASLNWIYENEKRVDAQLIQDPAINYVRTRKNTLIAEENGNKFCCFLRDLPNEYVLDESHVDVDNVKSMYENQLSEIVKSISKKTGLTPHLLPMHTFVVGGDDRQFNRMLCDKYFKDSNVINDNKIHSADSIIKNMLGSKLNICTRYHSVVFSETLNIPYLAIDYTNGGKVWSYLNDIGKLSNLITFESLTSGRWEDRVNDKLSLIH